MPPDDTAAPPPLRSVLEAAGDGTAQERVHVLIPTVIQRRMAERIAALRDEISAFVASLPTAQETRP